MPSLRSRLSLFIHIHTAEKSDFYSASVDVAIRLKDDWDRLLSDAGFAGVEYFGGFDFSAYDKGSSRRLIVIARK